MSESITRVSERVDAALSEICALRESVVNDISELRLDIVRIQSDLRIIKKFAQILTMAISGIAVSIAVSILSKFI